MRLKEEEEARLLLKRKRRKKKHHEEERRRKRMRLLHDKEVQTELDRDRRSVPATIKTETLTSGGPQKWDSQSQPHPQPFLSHQEHSIRLAALPSNRFSGLMHEEVQPNGGGRILHAYADELSRLEPGDMERFAQDFLDRTFSERTGAARYALAVVHGAAAYLPDFLDYFAFNFPNTPVKMEHMGKKDIETTTISHFHSQVVSLVWLCVLIM